jgi:hypothetical protein
MKKLFILLLITAFTRGIYAQELDSLKAIMDKKNTPEKAENRDNSSFAPVIVEEDGDEVNVKIMDKEVVKVIDSGDSTYVKVGDRGIIQVIDQPDSTRIRVGDKEISIVERNDDDAAIHIYDVDDDNKIRNPKFRGHWAGFEWGINNFLDDDLTISREGDNLFMDLNTSRSWAINLNFAQYSLGFGTSHFGVLTGLGLGYNNYFFDNNNTIAEVDDQVVGIDTTGITKSKLTATFLRVPLVFEIQFPGATRAKRVFISAGIVAGLKLGSHTKVVYKEENGKTRDKNNDDFNINPFRYGLTARIGFGTLCVFGDYYFTPMFVDGKGPELHPFSLGLAMTL